MGTNTRWLTKLLDLLTIKGAIVTIDAMGCQRDIARKILEKGADYIFSLKGNQGHMHADIKRFFEKAKKTRIKGIKMVIKTFFFSFLL